jgi:hypothetical protein
MEFVNGIKDILGKGWIFKHYKLTGETNGSIYVTFPQKRNLGLG